MADDEDFVFDEEIEEPEEVKEEEEEEAPAEEAPAEEIKVISLRPKLQPAKKLITRPVMTKIELAKVVSERVKQLEHNAPTTLSPEELGWRLDDVIQIAFLELVYGKSPMLLERRLPNGTYEVWNVNELELPSK